MARRKRRRLHPARVLAVTTLLSCGVALPIVVEAESQPVGGRPLPALQRVGSDHPTLVKIHDGRLTVRLSGVPLKNVLQEIARSYPVRVFVDPSIIDANLTAELDGVPLEEGLRRLLRDHSFVFEYRKTGDPPISELAQIRVYPAGTAASRGAESAAAAGRPLVIGERTVDDRLPQLAGQALDAPDPAVRQWAVEALHDTRERDAIPALLKALNDPNADVRVKALQALHDLGVATAMHQMPTEPFLQAVRWDPHPAVRRAALDLVASLADESQHPEAVAAVEHARHDSDPDIRRYAQDLLRERRRRIDADTSGPPSSDPPVRDPVERRGP